MKSSLINKEENNLKMSSISLFIICFPCAVILCTTATFVGLRRDKDHSFTVFHMFNICALGILLGNFAELNAATAQTSVLCCRLTYPLISFLAVFWYLFARKSSGKDSNGQLRFLALLSIIPIATICLQATNDIHGLVWRRYHFERIDGHLVNHVDAYGPWFWVHVIYSYGLYALGAIDLLAENLGRHRRFRLRAALTVVAVGIPVFANVAYVAHNATGIYWDNSALTFALSGFLLTIVMVKYQLFTVAPPPRRQVYDSLDQGLTVLDAQGSVIDMNAAALRHFGLDEPPLGQPLSSMPCFASLDLIASDILLTPSPPREVEIGGRRLHVVAQEVTDPGRAAYRIIVSFAAAHVEPEPISAREAESATRHIALRTAVEAFTDRERAVYELMLTDMSNKEIAYELKVKQNTLKTHTRHIFRKTGYPGRRELARAAREILRP
jgi:DNA-binding CsgD family transcriptional regulator/PAS domain-containing protein